MWCGELSLDWVCSAGSGTGPPHPPVMRAAGLTLDQEPGVGPGVQLPAVVSWAWPSARHLCRWLGAEWGWPIGWEPSKGRTGSVLWGCGAMSPSEQASLRLWFSTLKRMQWRLSEKHKDLSVPL